MALQITAKLSSLAKQTAKTPILILEVEGIPTIFGSSPLFESAKWDLDHITWDDGVTTWDGSTPIADQLTSISFERSTKRVTQQIRPDKEGASSVSTIVVDLVDLDNKIAPLFAFDNLTEQLGKKCRVFYGLKGGEHPRDSLPLFYGFVDDFSFEAGRCIISISHPDNLKRQELYTEFQTELAVAVDDTITTFEVDTSNGLITPQDVVRTYLKIGDEIVEVTNIAGTTLTVVRGRFNTTSTAHDIDTELLSLYTVDGNPIELALKTYLSTEGNAPFVSAETIESINYVSPTESLIDSIIFSSEDIIQTTGLVAGDSVTLVGSAFNDGTHTVLTGGILADGRSFIQVTAPLTTEVTFGITFSYLSQFNVLPDGAGIGLLNDEVDVVGMLNVRDDFLSDFEDYDTLFIDEEKDGKEFVDKELLYTQGIYTIPRKARVSCTYSAPPLASDITPTLDTTTIKNPGELGLKRTIHKFLYNAVQFKYDYDPVAEKFLARRSTFNTDSTVRIPTGNRVLTIESKGLVNNAQTNSKIDRIARRLLDRYKFGATQINNVKMLYRDGVNIEVSDRFLFGGDPDLQLPDPNTGKRNLKLKLYEALNKSLDIKRGEITLNLLDTGFSLENNRAVISNASGVASGSTTTRIIVEPIVDSSQWLYERQKWESFVGAKIIIRSADYTTEEETTILALDNSNQNGLLVDTLSGTPAVGSIVEFSLYDNQVTNTAGDAVKIKYCHRMASPAISVSDTTTSFDIDDTSYIFIGQKITVRSPDYTTDSFDDFTTIDNIIGNTITLTDALSFTPQVGDIMETYSFSDGRDGYVYL